MQLVVALVSNKSTTQISMTDKRITNKKLLIRIVYDNHISEKIMENNKKYETPEAKEALIDGLSFICQKLFIYF